MNRELKRFPFVIFFILFATNAFGQKYLIKNRDWVLKIQKHPELSPLSFGVKKTEEQIFKENQMIDLLVQKFKTKDIAYKQQIIDGWNYFTIGKVDSAIISFNQAYLIDTACLETFIAIGSIIAYLDGDPGDELFSHYHLMDKVSSPWDLGAFGGNIIFLEKLKDVHKKIQGGESLFKILTINTLPFKIDSSKYVMIKIQSGNSEGYYKMGRPYGQWTDYYDINSRNVARHYTIIDNREVGKVTAYHRNGKLSTIFYKDENGNIDGDYEIFDYNGDLVRIEYWHKNSHNEKDSKIIKEWEEDGITTEIVDGKFKEFIWKNGKKLPK